MRSLIWVLCAVVAAGCGGDDGGGGGDVDGGVDPSGDGGGNGTIDAAVSGAPTAYRITIMELKDPHAFAFGSFDVTGTLNGELATAMDEDNNPEDGNLDLNIVVVHRPLAQGAASTAGEVSFPNCSGPPVLSTECTLPADGQSEPTTLTNGSSTCLDVVPDTTSNFDPPVEATQAPCFATEAESLTVDLGGTVVPLIDAQLAARYLNEPADELDSGLIRGFLTEETADNTTISEDVAVVGGQPVSSILRDQDKDTGPNGEDGWWFYLNYTALEVPYAVE